MKTAVLNVIGNIQEVGYRTRVIGYAHSLNIVGYVKNLPDGRVEIVAQASEDILKEFINDITIQDPFIYVDKVKVKYTDEFEGFTDFHKIVGPNETDSRLDKAVDQLKEINQSIQSMSQIINETMNKNHMELVNKIDQNHTELLTEVRGLRDDNSERVMNEVRDVASEIQEVKALLKAHLKQS